MAWAHSASTSDVDLLRLALSAGLVDETGAAPYICKRFALAAVTTTKALAADAPLGPDAGRNGWRSHGPDWQMGRYSVRSAAGAEPFAKRPFHLAPYPFEALKRVEKPTTFMDEPRIPRFPKRAAFFARALFGDMGKSVQEVAKGGYYVVKSPIEACARRALWTLHESLPVVSGRAVFRKRLSLGGDEGPTNGTGLGGAG